MFKFLINQKVLVTGSFHEESCTHMVPTFKEECPPMWIIPDTIQRPHLFVELEVPTIRHKLYLNCKGVQLCQSFHRLCAQERSTGTCTYHWTLTFTIFYMSTMNLKTCNKFLHDPQ